MGLLEELKNLTAKLHSQGIEYALCGSLAMAIYAMPRATLGIDIMIELGILFRTKRIVEDLGFTLSGAPMEFHGGKVQIYRLCKVDAQTSRRIFLHHLKQSKATSELAKRPDDPFLERRSGIGTPFFGMGFEEIRGELRT